MKRTKLAYMAGLVDGEGCIYVGAYHEERGSKIYRLILQVQMTSKSTIRWIQKNFGGRITRHSPRGTQKLVSYKWYVSNDNAAKILELIHPYMVTKKNKANLACKFRDLLNRTAYRRDIRRDEIRDKFIVRFREAL